MTDSGERRFDLGLVSTGGFRPGFDGGSLAALDLLRALQSCGVRVCALCLYPAEEFEEAAGRIESWFQCSLVPRSSAAVGREAAMGHLHEARGCGVPLFAAPLSGRREQLWRDPASLLPEAMRYLHQVPVRTSLTCDADHLGLLAVFFERLPGLHVFNSLSNVREVARLGRSARRVLAARRIVAVSDYLHEQILECLGFEAAVMHPVWRIEEYRCGRRVAGRGTVGFYAGGVPQAKGDEIVLDAARRLPDTSFLVVGPSLFRGCEKLPDNVIEVGRLRDMRDFYSQIDLLIAPSVAPEGFPRVVIEAGINGIPPIASRAGGLPEAVGEGGVLIEMAAANEEDVRRSGCLLADAIRWLRSSPVKRAELGNQASSQARRLRLTQAQRVQELARHLKALAPPGVVERRAEARKREA